ncbi:MAG: S49 family peptidase [Isosphaeraceae bacterium]
MSVRAGAAGVEQSPRIAVIDVDGLLVNQNLTGPYAAGDNPVASFREKLDLAASDPRIRAVVLRIHSPGGGVSACDIMAEDLRRFRNGTGKPVVACLLDVATGGAYYLAIGADRVIALPTSITGAIGAVVNHANLKDAMAQLNVQFETIKSSERVDMGTVTEPLDEQSRTLFQEMANGFGERFRARVQECRHEMTKADRQAVSDGRIVPATQAARLHGGYAGLPRRRDRGG